MPRKIYTFDPNSPYHIGARCINKEWFTSLKSTWEILEDYLYLMAVGFGVDIYSFVLMSNHFHLIAQFPDSNMSEAMGYFMRETSKKISKSSKRINQTYGSRFYRSKLATELYLRHAYKYVYRNPVEAKLCNRVETYRYSTLSCLLGANPLVIPLTYDEILFENANNTLTWLNEAPDETNKQAVKRALSRGEFKLPKNRRSRGTHILESNDY